MSYEHCDKHDEDATNGCPDCAIEDVREDYGLAPADVAGVRLWLGKHRDVTKSRYFGMDWETLENLCNAAHAFLVSEVMHRTDGVPLDDERLTGPPIRICEHKDCTRPALWEEGVDECPMCEDHQ